MSDEHETYRRQAAMCQEFANRAVTPQLREDWIRLAEKWLAMIPRQDSVDAAANDKGDGQAGSVSSH